MFHSFNDFNDYFNKFEKDLYQLKEKGLIQKIGVSLYTNEEIEKVLEFDNIDLIQIPYNLLDNSNKRSEILIKAKQKGVEVHTRSAFLQGLFFKSLSELKGNLILAKPYLSEIKKIITKNNISIGELAINYCIGNKNINNVIIGVDSVEQLNINLNWTKSSINEKLIFLIDKINVKEEKLLNPSKW
jgi:aryl-alcohol dehydrogenase-like predicted oxidoreductase